VRYQPARRVRSFEDVVEQIRASIVTGTLPVGERLPSERELAETFGVSRPTLREALRVLEAMGLLDIRLGAQGGAFAGGDDRAPTNVISALLATQAVAQPAELSQLRASYHADNAYWADATRLTRLLDASTSPDGRQFLQMLAAATGNKLRELLADAIELAIVEAQLATATVEDDVQVAIARRIADGDRAGARDLVHATLSTPARPDGADVPS